MEVRVDCGIALCFTVTILLIVKVSGIFNGIEL